jgi:type I restriction enzyme S subunit
VKAATLDLSEVKLIAATNIEIERLKLLTGDILLTEGGDADKVGRGTLWNDELPCCLHQNHVFRARLDQRVALPRFIDLQLQADVSRAYFLSHAKQTTGIATINQSVVRNCPIWLPSVSDQKRIAATLDEQLSSIDAARQAAERRVKAAGNMEAALFREFFHGITPVVIGTPKDAAPAGWTWQRLSKLADLESGHTPSRKHPEWWGGEIPWIALPDIRALDGKVAMETKENTNPLGIANSSARILPDGTVVLSRTASVGFVSMMGRPMATSQDFVNFVCGAGLAPRFLMHALRASREYLLANASGAIHKTIYMPAVKEFHLCLPERKTQDKLTARLDAQLVDAATLLTAARAELAAIQALPAAVLRRVFGTSDDS